MPCHYDATALSTVEQHTGFAMVRRVWPWCLGFDPVRASLFRCPGDSETKSPSCLQTHEQVVDVQGLPQLSAVADEYVAAGTLTDLVKSILCKET